MKVLVTGGAGYIGSVTVKQLQNNGYEPVVFDNLYQGHKDSVNCQLIQGNLENKDELFSLLDSHTFDGVIHFAAYALAGESMQNPYKYFYGNLLGGLNLLEFMKHKKIPYIIFSSSCSIYGKPDKLPVTEEESKKPESVYGESKLQFEKILRWYDEIFSIKHVNLRYFNAAGASLDGILGERHDPESHIIPIALSAALGKIPEFTLYGDDYPTADGTCIRDYIHVEDLASAHIKALEHLVEHKTSNSYNLGTGKGYSNREVIDTIKKVSGNDFPVKVIAKRIGDPPEIYADNSKAKNELGWVPEHSDLETIVQTSWNYLNKAR